MRLIVISTALESDPPETVYPVVVASALIQLAIRQAGRVAVRITQDPFIGGKIRQSGRVNVFISEGIRIQARFRQTATVNVTYT